MMMQGMLAAIVLAAGAGLAAVAGTELPDQHGGRDSLAAHAGEPVVVVVVDARRLGTVRRWEQELLARFPGLRVLTVADVNEQRPTELARVATVLARRVPPEVRVLIDMERQWALALGLDTAAPNLLLVSREGALVESFRGRWSAEAAEVVLARVAALGGGT
jgi:hypothetical protein